MAEAVMRTCSSASQALARTAAALCAAAPFAGAMAATPLADPMLPPARAAQVPPASDGPVQTRAAAPTLRMVLASGDTRRALVGAQWVRVGDRLADDAGARVLRITDRSVVLQRGQSTEELTLPSAAVAGVARSRP